MSETMWRGKLLHVHIATEASAPMRELTQARLVAGVGIEGDRYATGRGTYSNTPRPDRQVTLIELEALEALARDYQIRFTPQESRRNLTTIGVPLNHLVGQRFRVGEVVLRGARLNVPCKYLEQVTGKAVFGPLTHRSGLNCEVESDGTIRPGDVIEPIY
jgi:MOSC domain-containing protein YiiM